MYNDNQDQQSDIISKNTINFNILSTVHVGRSDKVEEKEERISKIINVGIDTNYSEEYVIIILWKNGKVQAINIVDNTELWAYIKEGVTLSPTDVFKIIDNHKLYWVTKSHLIVFDLALGFQSNDFLVLPHSLSPITAIESTGSSMILVGHKDGTISLYNKHVHNFSEKIKTLHSSAITQIIKLNTNEIVTASGLLDKEHIKFWQIIRNEANVASMIELSTHQVGNALVPRQISGSKNLRESGSSRGSFSFRKRNDSETQDVFIAFVIVNKILVLATCNTIIAYDLKEKEFLYKIPMAGLIKNLLGAKNNLVIIELDKDLTQVLDVESKTLHQSNMQLPNICLYLDGHYLFAKDQQVFSVKMEVSSAAESLAIAPSSIVKQPILLNNYSNQSIISDTGPKIQESLSSSSISSSSSNNIDSHSSRVQTHSGSSSNNIDSHSSRVQTHSSANNKGKKCHII